MSDNSVDNKRIAKNTLLLYLRTIVIMLINLYMSRVVLKTLGVEDYGVYNAVGGVVAMFSIVSGALSGSISRYITFELGRGNKDKLHLVFCTSLNIMVGLSFIVVLIAEPICVWFLNTQMVIPEERLYAANWVFQCSLLMFCVNLISVPYNAAIIAHERMSAFAYISILEAVLRLAVVLLLAFLPFDNLIVYALLLAVVALIVLFIYFIYCNRHFYECHYSFVHERRITKEMTKFAGWSFLTNTAFIFNTHGVNLLTNLYFGVTMNASRGIATQVDNAVMQFVTNFTMALNPQITKSYAQNNFEDTFRLVCQGAKFSFYLMLLFAIPLIAEADYLLVLWLGDSVPPQSALFVKLGIIAAIVDRFGSVITTACFATGSIKNYTIWVSITGCLAFLLSWLFYYIGLPVESSYYAFILTYLVVNVVRLWMMKTLLGFSPMMFIREVLFRSLPTLVVASIVPILIISKMESSGARLIITVICSTIFTAVCVYLIGMTKTERKAIVRLIRNKIHV